MLQRDDRGALARVDGAPDRPALLPRSVDEALREELVPFTHGRDADLTQQVKARACRVDGGNGRRAVLEAARALAWSQALDVEGERVGDAPPAHRGRMRALRDFPPRVEERDAGSAHEPLERAADEVIDPADVHVK